MAKIKEIIVEVFLPAIKRVGKIEIENVLTAIEKNNTPEIYHNTLQGLYSNFSLLSEVAHKTKTKIDDGIIDLILEAVKESAEDRGIVLS